MGDKLILLITFFFFSLFDRPEAPSHTFLPRGHWHSYLNLNLRAVRGAPFMEANRWGYPMSLRRGLVGCRLVGSLVGSVGW